ncbi:MAG: phosphoribosylamine--glycine ligase [Myxococcota bacterium]
MKVLVIGSGGREHAIVRALSTGEAEIAVSPGNPGTATIATNVAGLTSNDEIVRFAKDQQFDLVVVGPEAPLVAGLGDALRTAGIPCCGPDAAPSTLEGSKIYTRELGAQIGLPQPNFAVVHSPEEIEGALATLNGIPVVKADGLAAGKGVSLPDDLEGVRRDTEALLRGSMGDAGAKVVLEERLEGTEASLFFACSGTDAVELPNARDHKRLLDEQRGPNTGGMGAVSPNPELDANTRAIVSTAIVRPTLQALKERGTPFVGFLYVGVMLTAEGPKLVEFNVRLGDPEAQCILPRLRPGTFLELCRRTATGELSGFSIDWDERPTVAVVLSTDGYPSSPRKGDVIELASELENDDRWLDHAGTRLEGKAIVTSGGRVAAVVARGSTVEDARARAYDGVGRVRFNGMHTRSDIGA